MVNSDDTTRSVDDIISNANKQHQVKNTKTHPEEPRMTITQGFEDRIWEYMEKHNIKSRTIFLEMGGLEAYERELYKAATERLPKWRRVTISSTIFTKIQKRLNSPPDLVLKDNRSGTPSEWWDLPKEKIDEIVALSRTGASYERIFEETGVRQGNAENAVLSRFRKPTPQKMKSARLLKEQRFHERSIRGKLKLTHPEYLVALGGG